MRIPLSAEVNMQCKQDMIDEIAAAFAGVSRDGGVSLHQAEVKDDYGSRDEELAARELDTDATWLEVPEEDIAGHWDILSFLDPIGFRYYIPAYMVWTLDNLDSNSADATVSALTQPVCKKPDHVQYRKYAIFSDSQRKAIGHFLQHLCDVGYEDPSDRPARRGLAYWLGGRQGPVAGQ